MQLTKWISYLFLIHALLQQIFAGTKNLLLLLIKWFYGPFDYT